MQMKATMFLVIITPPSGQGLVIPVFFRALYFCLGHLPQTSGFRLAKQIIVTSFATQPGACILGDHNIFYTPRVGRTMAGSNAPGAFLVTNIKFNSNESGPEQPRGPPSADSADREAYRRGPAPGMEPKGGAGSDFRPEFVSLHCF